jgi:hypothetical protein
MFVGPFFILRFLFSRTFSQCCVKVNFLFIFRSELCVEAAAKCESIGPLKRALKLRSDLIYPTCEAFSRLFRGHHDTLIKQVCNSSIL